MIVFRECMEMRQESVETVQRQLARAKLELVTSLSGSNIYFL